MLAFLPGDAARLQAEADAAADAYINAAVDAFVKTAESVRNTKPTVEADARTPVRLSTTHIVTDRMVTLRRIVGIKHAFETGHLNDEQRFALQAHMRVNHILCEANMTLPSPAFAQLVDHILGLAACDALNIAAYVGTARTCHTDVAMRCPWCRVDLSADVARAAIEQLTAQHA